MLAIRMQRTGRKGHAMFRVVVQDSRRTPTSGRVVAQLGSYDPHAKTIIINKEKADFYLEHGAQPSDRVVRLFKSEGVTLPSWVSVPSDKQRTVRHAEKRRSSAPAPTEEPEAEATTSEEVVDETPAEAVEASETETPAEEVEAPTEEAEEEAPAAEEAPEAEAPSEEAKEEETTDSSEADEK